jgi:hypothetical protein
MHSGVGGERGGREREDRCMDREKGGQIKTYREKNTDNQHLITRTYIIVGNVILQT